uniref:Uncharacterized protein n=1 Tax=Cucumis melo TaxID=3656 RepID=A0A9I9CGX3_CUCME
MEIEDKEDEKQKGNLGLRRRFQRIEEGGKGGNGDGDGDGDETTAFESRF